MMTRFEKFKDGGVPETHVHAEWLERRVELRCELLCLPAAAKKGVGRKRIDVAGRILTLELMHEIDQTTKERDAAAKKTKEMRAIRAKKKKKNEITSIGADEQGLDDVDGDENNVGDDNEDGDNNEDAGLAEFVCLEEVVV
ncbi:hypothetical protein DYB37_009226 [Aphanomyces astaci]|uniref:Uncharacterized protein n=1 Tax=Aphanomyces astaci TaxID=112090 RepID=A0A3R7AMB9_APHAT|nr:hypothetical protein DYB35_009618 [Aphanomyces astaci]RHZ28337.1 hypothetical protein DYB37_009226 [Aphanomyces astaci]